MDAEITVIMKYLGLLPFFVGIGIFLLYLSAKYRSRNIHNRLNSIRFLLRDFQFQLNKHKNELQGYSIYDPIPFGPLVASSDQYFQETEFFFHELLKRYGEIKEKSNSTQTLRKIYYHISPATWHKIDRSVGELTKQCSNFANKIDMLSEIRNKIFQANWEIAKSCQELVRSLNESFITVEQIRQIGLYGDELERTHSEITKQREWLLEKIPALYFSIDKSLVIDQAKKEVSVHVYGLLQTLMLDIGTYQEKIRKWLEVHKSYALQFEAIERDILELNFKMNYLENSNLFPVFWGQTRQRVEQVIERKSEFLSINSPKSVSELDYLSTRIKDLKDELDRELNHVTRLYNAHLELCSITMTQEISLSTESIKSAYQLVKAIGNYDPENFSKGDKPDTIKDELDDIAAAQGRFNRVPVSAHLNEDEIDNRLEIAKKLYGLHRILDARLESIRNKWEIINGQETNSLLVMNKIGDTIEEIEGIIHRKSPIKKFAEREMQKINQQYRHLLLDLENKRSGIIEKKWQRVQNLEIILAGDIERWQTYISENIGILKKTIVERLRIIREITWLDDPIITEIEGYLSNEVSIQGTAINNIAHEKLLTTAFNNLRKLDDYWHCLIDVEQRLIKISNPIITNYQRASNAQASTRVLLNKIDQVIPEDKEIWPPTSKRLGEERLLHKNLEDNWKSLKSDRLQVKDINGRLVELINGFQQLENSMREALSQAQSEQNRFRNFERRLEESRRLWKSVSLKHRDNPLVVSGVEELLLKAEHEITQIQKRYWHGGINYSLAIQGIRKLCRWLDEGYVALDSAHIIDINGIVQRRL